VPIQGKSRLIPNRWVVVTVIFSVLLLSPLLIIFFETFRSLLVIPLSDSGTENLSHFANYLLWDYLSDTLSLLTLTTIFSLIFALPSAYLLARYKIGNSKVLYWLNVLPLTIPTYIGGYIWAELFSFPNNGYWLLKNFFGSADVLNLFSLAMIFASVLYPYVFIQAHQVITDRLLGYSQVSNSLGAGRWEFFRKTGLRILSFPLTYGLLLVSLETLNDYGAVKYYGVDTLTSGIFKVWYGMGDLGSALMMSVILILLVISLRISVSYLKVAGLRQERQYQPKPADSLIRRFAHLIIVMLIPLVSFVLPFVYIAWGTLESITSDLDVDILIGSIGNSVLFSLSGAISILIISVIIAYTNFHFHSRKLEMFSSLSLIGYSVPGAVTAIGFMLIIGYFSSFFHIGYFIPLIFAYTVRYSMVGYAPIGGAIEDSSGRYSLISMSLGKNRFVSLIKATIPSAKSAVISSFVISMVEIMKDLPLTLILRDYGTETLSTSAYRYANDEQLIRSFPYGFLIILLGILVIFLTEKISTSKN